MKKFLVSFWNILLTEWFIQIAIDNSKWKIDSIVFGISTVCCGELNDQMEA